VLSTACAQGETAKNARAPAQVLVTNCMERAFNLLCFYSFVLQFAV